MGASQELTPASLLDRIRRGNDASAWDRFASLYCPLMVYWARSFGLQESDAADLVQDVFVVVLRRLRTFEYKPDMSFRAWLRTVLFNKFRERLRRKPMGPITEATLEQTFASSEEDDRSQYQLQIVHRALAFLEGEFQPATWQAFYKVAVLGMPCEEVARELGLSLNGVYIAKSRVLRRLREELQGLIS